MRTVGKWQAGKEGQHAGNLSVDVSEKVNRGNILQQQQFPVFSYLQVTYLNQSDKIAVFSILLL